MTNKKINLNEILSDEQFDTVSGGSINEVSSDSQKLFKLDIIDDTFNKISTTFSWGKITGMVEYCFRRVGVRCVTKPFTANEYYCRGHKISRGDALLIAQNYAEKNGLIHEN